MPIEGKINAPGTPAAQRGNWFISAHDQLQESPRGPVKVIQKEILIQYYTSNSDSQKPVIQLNRMQVVKKGLGEENNAAAHRL